MILPLTAGKFTFSVNSFHLTGESGTFIGSGLIMSIISVERFPLASWSSILSYDPDSSAFPVLFEGDRVQCTGYVYEYSPGPGGLTELFITEPVNIISVGVALPDTADVNTGDLRWPTEAEQWGTVMVRATNAIVVDNDLPYGEWTIDDGSGKVKVDDDSDSIAVWQEAVGRPPVGSYVSSIRGWVYNHYGSYDDSSTYKIETLLNVPLLNLI